MNKFEEMPAAHLYIYIYIYIYILMEKLMEMPELDHLPPPSILLGTLP